MTETLTIDCIAVNTPDDGQGLPVRVQRMMRRVADDRLERTLGSNSLGGNDSWCIREIALSALLDLARPDSSLEETIAQAVLTAISDAMATSDVVRYQRVLDALADLVTSAGLDQFERAWAWESIGLVGDPRDLEHRPGPYVLDVLAQHPPDALPAVLRAVGAIGLAPLHRLFKPSGWVRLADIVIDAYARSSTSTDVSVVLHGCRLSSAAVTPADVKRASWLAASCPLASSASKSRLRLDDQTSFALSVLAVAASEPAMLPRKQVVPLCLTLAQMFAGTLPAVVERVAAPAESVPMRNGTEPASIVGPAADRGLQNGMLDAAAPFGPPTVDAHGTTGRADPTEIEPPGGLAGDGTRTAGLLFLLNAADDAAMPGTLFDDPELDGIGPSELLARVALSLVDAADDDPAVLAFAGSDPKRLRPGWSHKALPPNVSERLAAHAVAWAAAAAGRLRRDDAPPLDVIAELTRRDGRIEREPGWMDVHLALADVDVDVRLAGLDIDPGWVPWVGSVVRFRYA